MSTDISLNSVPYELLSLLRAFPYCDQAKSPPHVTVGVSSGLTDVLSAVIVLLIPDAKAHFLEAFCHCHHLH